MKTFLFAIILIAMGAHAFPQQKSDQSLWHLTIVDNTSVKAVVRATVTINKKQHYYTNEYGEVSISKNLINAKDSVSISYVGYKSVVFVPGLLYKFPDTIAIQPLVTSLTEVRISPTNPTGIVIGDIQKKYNTHRIQNPNHEIVQFIPNTKKIKGTVASVEYVLNDELHGLEMPFRVGLYTKSLNNISPTVSYCKTQLLCLTRKKSNV